MSFLQAPITDRFGLWTARISVQTLHGSSKSSNQGDSTPHQDVMLLQKAAVSGRIQPMELQLVYHRIHVVLQALLFLFHMH